MILQVFLFLFTFAPDLRKTFNLRLKNLKLRYNND